MTDSIKSLDSPVYIFFGGMVQIFGAVGEWIIGNTFSCALFFTYGEFKVDHDKSFARGTTITRHVANASQLGTFWIVQGTSLIPWFGVGTNYSPTGNSLEGMKTPEFAATTGSSILCHRASLSPVSLVSELDLTDSSHHIYRSLLCSTFCPDFCIPALLDSHQHLPLSCPFPACDHIFSICGDLLSAVLWELGTRGQARVGK